MLYFGVACPEPPQYPPWQFHSRQTWLSKEGVPKLLGFKNSLHSLNLLKTPERFCLCVLYLWLFVALEDKTENLNKYKDISSCQSNDAFIYGVSGKLHCILIKEWEWEKQIEPFYQGNNFDLMVLFPVSRAPRSPQTVLFFFPKKRFVYLLFMYFCCLAVVSLHSCSEKRLLFVVLCTGFSLQWRLLLQSTDSTLLLALQLQGLRSCGSQAYLLHGM